MQQQLALNIQQYLDALREVEKQCAEHNAICSTSLILHPSGSGAVEVDFLFDDRQGIAIDFDPDEGDGIMEAIQLLAEKVQQGF